MLPLLLLPVLQQLTHFCPPLSPPPRLCQGDSQAVVTQVSLRRCGGAVKAQMLFRRAVTLIDQLEHFECVLVPR